ncbi:MAG: hypothetical protein ABJO02_05920 [Reichenbachiella sp.]|uniref:hypothetical protein n=1 Tax=Reichenbachiella sp. TaxID=2184521 RepID=UPI0032994C7F
METTDLERLDHLIRSKAYDQLSESEEKWILEHLPNEIAYTKIRHIVLELSSEPVPKLARSSKADLMRQFKTKHASPTYNWLNYRIPAHLSFLVAIGLAFLIWWISPSREIIIEKPVTVQLPGRIDTLFIHSKPDTVFIDKVRRIEVPIYITKKEEASPEKDIKGSSMAEQHELDDFLVRSSSP